MSNRVPIDSSEAGRPRAAKLAVLHEAARVGFADIDEGRYRDVTDATLEEYVVGLGKQASERVLHGAGKSGDW